MSDTLQTEAPSAAPAAPTDEGLRSAFPSMYEGEPPAPAEPARTATPPPEPASPTAATAAATPTTPAAEPPAPEVAPVELRASGLSVSLPVGVAPDAESLAAFDTVARDLGLDGAAAQKLVDLHTAATERYSGEINSAWDAQRAEWRAAAERDPEIGGPHLNENVALARSVLDRFGGGFKAAMTDLGIGNHPELVRLLVRVGRALDGAAPSRGPDLAREPQGGSDDQVYRDFFPSMFTK